MLRSKYRFSLDIKLTQSQVSIPVMLNDTIWGFYINLIDNGKPFLLPDGCRAVFVAKKPDGNTLFNDCIIVGNHIIQYDFTANTTNVEGVASCEIRVYGPAGRMLTCPRFTMVVDSRVLLDDEIVLSESEHTALDSIIASEYARQQAESEREARSEEALKAAQEAIEKAKITHSWEGTVLHVTSNSGTSSADLKGEQGIQGETGNGIREVEYNGSEGLEDSYTIHFTNGSGFDYRIRNGKDGIDGKDGKDAEVDPTLSKSGAAADAKATSDAIANGIRSSIDTHNTNQEAHNDIRIALQELSAQVSHFLDVDDTKRDQLSELLALIDENIDNIENLVAGYVKYTDIIDNLETSLSDRPLSAKQGVVLKALIEEVRAQIGTALNAHNHDGTAHAGILEKLDDLDTEMGVLASKVTVLENAKPNLEGYVTTAQFEAALGAYITDIDNIVGGGIEGGESGEETPTIKGVWLFNESIADGGEGAGTYTVSFSSYAFPFTTMDLLYEGFGYTISYDDTAVMTGASGADSGYWNIEQYRTVDFGDTEQAVPEEFLAWMQAHATQISESGGSTG